MHAVYPALVSSFTHQKMLSKAPLTSVNSEFARDVADGAVKYVWHFDRRFWGWAEKDGTVTGRRTDRQLSWVTDWYCSLQQMAESPAVSPNQTSSSLITDKTKRNDQRQKTSDRKVQDNPQWDVCDLGIKLKRHEEWTVLLMDLYHFYSKWNPHTSLTQTSHTLYSVNSLDECI